MACLRVRGEATSSSARLLHPAAGMAGGHVQRWAVREVHVVQWVDVAEYTTVKPDAIVMHQPHHVLRVLSAIESPLPLHREAEVCVCPVPGQQSGNAECKCSA